MSSKRQFRVDENDKVHAINYFNRKAPEYERRVARGPLRFLRERERRAVVALAEFVSNEKYSVIDVGGGSGFYALEAEHFGHDSTAVDAAPEMVKELKKTVHSAWQLDIEKETTPNTYDVVVCSGVLDFVARPERAFANLCRMVSPNGALVIQVPRAGVAGYLYRAEKWLAGFRVNLFDLDWFRDQAIRYDFWIDGVRYPLPYNMVVRLVRSKEEKEDL